MMANNDEKNSEPVSFFSLWILLTIVVVLLAAIITPIQAARKCAAEESADNVSLFLSMIWIIAAVVVTAILTIRSNSEVIKEARNQDERPSGRDYVHMASLTNQAISVVAILVIVGAILGMLGVIPEWWVHAGAGPLLVLLVTVFDCLFARIKKEAFEKLPGSHSGNPDWIAAGFEHWKARAILRIVDYPILVGVLLIFGCGMLTREPASYVSGYLAGATAFQLLVGNISYTAIQSLQNSAESAPATTAP